MVLVLRVFICLLTGYAFGCFSTAYMVGKFNHVDIRKYGSGNAGTTNALRTLGYKAGIITFLGDFFKAVIPMLLFREVIFSGSPDAQFLGLCAGFGVVLGHNFPFWLHFKGGKGIAVTAGVMATFNPWLILVMVVLFGVSVGITKYVSVGSLVIALAFPVCVAIICPGQIHILIVAVLYTASAFIKHRTNIKRLHNGTENKIGQKVKIK